MSNKTSSSITISLRISLYDLAKLSYLLNEVHGLGLSNRNALINKSLTILIEWLSRKNPPPPLTTPEEALTTLLQNKIDIPASSRTAKEIDALISSQDSSLSIPDLLMEPGEDDYLKSLFSSTSETSKNKEDPKTS